MGFCMEFLNIEDIEKASKVLKDEEVLAFPTETVYGVGCVYDSKVAFERLVAIKRRPPNKPFALMCSSLEEAAKYIEVSDKAKSVMDHFLPGELTVLVNAKKSLPEWVTLGTNVIGIRVPDSPFVKKLIEAVGRPLLVTSANKSGEPTTKYFNDVVKAFGDELPAVVKGECESLTPTTIINLTADDKITLVREGPIPFEKILAYWEEQ